MEKTILYNPQWQGGGDPVTLYGARELRALYLDGLPCLEPPVSLGTDELAVEQGVAGYAVLARQLRAAGALLRERAPERLFSVGGGCDADLPAAAYLAERWGEELAVLWFDAHGDLNAPEESASHLLYGMPARLLLDGGVFPGLVGRPLAPARFVHLGGRDFDEAERRCLAGRSIPTVSVETLERDPSAAAAALAATGCRRVHIHLDLDVLEPAAFPDTPLPVPGGLSVQTLLAALEAVCRGADVLGFGLYEYAPCGRRLPALARIVELALSC